MHILVIGGAGMIGRKLAHRLAASGLGGDAAKVTLYDLGFPDPGDPYHLTGSLADKSEAARLAALRPDVIFHLAAVVSGEAEADFEKGMSVNLTGTQNLLAALRNEHEKSDGAYRARLIFTSSIAVFGGPYPAVIPDNFHTKPQTSYGAQKAIGELLVSDYSRRGFVDGICLRLPTICVRPGQPNKAASSFFSGIIREPLAGQSAVLPVPDTMRHWLASPKAAVSFLLHAAQLSTDDIGGARVLNLPGVSCTIAEMIEALRKIAGQQTVDLIRYQPDKTIMAIVKDWPGAFAADTATALGFQAETGFSQIIRTYIAEDMPGSTNSS